MRDPYAVLGVPRGADQAAIKAAYRKLAKKLHPDQNPDDPSAKERFGEINTAYEVIGDATRRAAFDRGEIDAAGNPAMSGFSPFGGPGGAGRSRAQGGPNPGFEDLFAQFGAGRARGASGRGQPNFGQSPGAEDILRSMFGEGAAGAGSGPGFGTQGGPRAARSASTAKGADIKASASPTLEEIVSGQKVQVSLGAQGSVKIALPRGVQDGQTIRLKGKGAPSPEPGGKPGDALVSVHFAPHPHIKAEGHHLVMDLPITLDEAVLGARIEVPTLDGRVAINVPMAVPSGRTMRLKSRGLPDSKGGRGDLLIRLLIKLPPEGDEALSALMKRWRADGRYRVREA